MTRPTISLLVAFALLVPAANAAAQGKNKISCGADVSLEVTVSGTRLAAGGYGLVSDGLGAYRDGTKGAAKVMARFQVDNCTHDFTMNLHTSSRATWALLSDGDRRSWFFNLDRVHSVPITVPSDQSQLDALDAFCASTVVVDSEGRVVRNQAGWYYDNYGGCGVDEYGQTFVRRGGGFDLDGDRRLSFRIPPIDRPALCGQTTQDPACGASYFRVYRPDSNTWIVRTEPPAAGVYRESVGGEGYQVIGTETMPFEITAVRR